MLIYAIIQRSRYIWKTNFETPKPEEPVQFWKQYWALVRPFKFLIAVAFGLIILTQLVQLFNQFLYKTIFDLIGILAGTENSGAIPLDYARQFVDTDSQATALCAAVVLVTFLSANVIIGGVEFKSRRASMRLTLKLNLWLQNHSLDILLRQSIGWHQHRKTGASIKQVDEGTNAIGAITDFGFYSLLPQLVVIPLITAMAFYFEWRVGLIFLVLIPISTWLTQRTVQQTDRDRKNKLDSYEESTSLLHEILANMSTVLLFGQERNIRNKFGRIQESLLKSSWNEANQFHRMSWQQRMLRTMASLVVIAISLWQVREGTTSIGTPLLMIALCGQLLGSINQAVEHYGRIAMQQEGASRLFKLLKSHTDISVPSDPIPVDGLRGAITFENVSFGYPDSGREALHQVSFAAEPGKMLAIVGPSGGGKSTLVKLALRAFDADAGSILIDGQNIRKIDLTAFRAQIGFVSQTVDLFTGTVAENIAFGKPDATMAEIKHAAQLACIDAFIQSLPDGYQTQVK
ncbi:MAG: ABC transporter ATP-binding protein, partial [Candidatus Uhrbacteria bacterium]